MESNGVKGRIHVSQATADALTAAGKASWLTPREDKIVAKGKGLMQTYWVQINAGSSGQSCDDNTSNCDLFSDGDASNPDLVANNDEPQEVVGERDDKATMADVSHVST